LTLAHKVKNTVSLATCIRLPLKSEGSRPYGLKHSSINRYFCENFKRYA